jgi:cyclic-di-GMP-binding protein
MPSFDVVSEVDKHELTNAVDQAQRELGNRFDFRNVDARFSLEGSEAIAINAPSEFQLQQMRDILDARLVARGIDKRVVEPGDVETNVAGARQKLAIRQGIEQKIAKQIIGEIKAAKLKVETQINGEKLRISGKKRDDLQTAIALLRKSEVEVPLQFENFRD